MNCLTCMRIKLSPQPKTSERCDYSPWAYMPDIEKAFEEISEYLSHKEWCAWNRSSQCNCGYEEIRKNIRLFLMGSHTDKDETCSIQYKRDNNE